MVESEKLSVTYEAKDSCGDFYTNSFFAKSEVAKNYICLLGEINGIGILSTLKSENSFPFWKTFCISEKEMFPEI